MYKFIFKLIVCVILILSCSDIDRDNLLDPKNSDSFSETPILVEAFVNNTFGYDQTALDALEDIDIDFSENMNIEIVVYHRDHPDDPDDLDPYINPVFTSLHEKYANTYEQNSMAVPDIYINGSQGRAKGASDATSVYDRLAPIITDIAGHQSEYALEVEFETSEQALTVEYRIARLGNNTAKNLELNIIFIKDYDSPFSRRVVDDIRIPAKTINKIEAGEYSEGNISGIILTNQPDYAIFTITKQDDITVLKTLKKAISW